MSSRNNLSIYDINVSYQDNKIISMEEYRGKILLIVNVASRCGFTPQYQALERLYQEFKDKNFVILGFPCNQFLKQEPGTNEEILSFCKLHYGVTFPIFDKIAVNGTKAHELYQYLKSQKSGFLGCPAIKWNFTKFLVDPNGHVLKRFAPITKPEKIARYLKKTIFFACK